MLLLAKHTSNWFGIGLVVGLLGLVLLPACASGEAPPPQSTAAADTLGLPYDFAAPAGRFQLPKSLTEISGLTYLEEGLLGAVEDENGRIYLLDAQTGALVDDRRFAKDGDYEGIERVGERLFVLRSDGDLYEIEDWRADDLEYDKHDLDLGSRYDTEGLAYDAAHHRLLIACKEYPGKGYKGHRAIYAFDLATNTRSEAPVILLNIDDVHAASASEHPLNSRIRSLLSPVTDLSDFKPSALAIHPGTGHLYLLSSVLKALALLEPDGTLLAVFPLDGALMPQPEGLAFAPNGDLFIATEGRGDRAYLLRFPYQP